MKVSKLGNDQDQDLLDVFLEFPSNNLIVSSLGPEVSLDIAIW